MTNEKQPVRAVREFMEEAVSLGCYTPTQKYNFETAWAVLMKALPRTGLTDESSVEQLRPKVAELLRHHGGTTKISAGSLKAYQARINRLLEDFTKYHGGDFMAWKEAKSRSGGGGEEGKARRQRKKTARVRNGSGKDMDDEPRRETITHRLIAAGTKEGRIEIPTGLSEAEVDAIWVQLDAIRTLVKAQIAAMGGKSAKVSPQDSSGSV